MTTGTSKRRLLARLLMVAALALPVSTAAVGRAAATGNSLDRRATANLAIYYGVCRTYYCVNGPASNEGGEVGTSYDDYANFNQNDCTNFTSNMLHIGGTLDRSYVDRYNRRPNDSDKSAWYSYRDAPRNADFRSYHRSESWRLVTQFWQYMSGQGNPSGRNIAYFTNNDPSNSTNDADLGDVVLLDPGMSSSPNYDHVMLETGYGPDNSQQGYSGAQTVEPGYYGDLISQHGAGRSDHSWNYGYTKETNQTYRYRMHARGWYVMHWRSGYNGY